MDLFTVRHNAQLPQYFSFKPDPGAVAVDAFAQDWSSLTPYVFPPFLMVGRYLQKIREEKVEKAVIVTPLSALPGDRGLRSPTLRLGDCGKAGAY